MSHLPKPEQQNVANIKRYYLSAWEVLRQCLNSVKAVPGNRCKVCGFLAAFVLLRDEAARITDRKICVTLVWR